MIVDCAIYEDGKRRDGHVDLKHAYDDNLTDYRDTILGEATEAAVKMVVDKLVAAKGRL